MLETEAQASKSAATLDSDPLRKNSRARARAKPGQKSHTANCGLARRGPRTNMRLPLLPLLLLPLLSSTKARWIGRMARRGPDFRGASPKTHVTSPPPAAGAAPSAFDWRFSKGPGLVSRIMSQQAPHVCGSCWAEAAMGALSDRYRIATEGAVDVQLASQVLLNFDPTVTGGDCNGGDDKMT